MEQSRLSDREPGRPLKSAAYPSRYSACLLMDILSLTHLMEPLPNPSFTAARLHVN